MKLNKDIVIEVCATSIMSAIAAEQGGAQRIELCDNIHEGGTTPSAGAIKLCKEKLDLDVCILLRPRGGDFLYNDVEFELMKQDIIIAKELGADGIVTGILDKNGLVDMERMRQLIEIIHPMEVVFHRAFDMTSDPTAALDQLIELKVDRLLTSGQKKTAIEGASLIRELVNQAAGRIDIMPGSGINTGNFLKLMKLTRARDFHLTGRSPFDSLMNYISDNAILNSFNHEDDFQWLETDENIISEMVRLSKVV